MCLSQGFYSCTNIMTKKQVGVGRVYSAYISTLLFITERSQDWNSSRSGSRSWCRGHGGIFLTGLLPLACSAYSLIDPKITSPEMVPPTRDPPPWSLIEKMLYSWISWRHIPNWSSFLCDNSSLCQVDTQTHPMQGISSFWANIHLSVSAYYVCSFVTGLPHSRRYFLVPSICLRVSWSQCF